MPFLGTHTELGLFAMKMINGIQGCAIITQVVLWKMLRRFHTIRRSYHSFYRSCHYFYFFAAFCAIFVLKICYSTSLDHIP